MITWLCFLLIKHLVKPKEDVREEFQSQISKSELLFLTADDLKDFLDKIKADSVSTESTVSGYNVCQLSAVVWRDHF